MGVVVRRSPGVTRWVREVWRVVDMVPGAPDVRWKLLREEDGVAEFLAGSRDVTLYVSDTEAYVHELQAQVPSFYAVLRKCQEAPGLDLLTVTASPYEAQDYEDSAEDIVERVPMPASVLAWVRDFVARHHVEEPFVKRRRSGMDDQEPQTGIGDARIAKTSDVYSVPHRALREAAE